MQREEMLAKVEAAYQARRDGDFAALQEIVSDDARFTYGGEQSLIAAVPAVGAGHVMQAARELFERIEIRDLKQVTAVAEGNRVAILWDTTLVTQGGEPFATQMFDLWEFDADGRICCGTQFLDTAKLIQQMQLA